MLSRIGRFVAGLLGGDASDVADGDESDGHTFAGSALDWSVDYSHEPTGSAEASREMARVQEKAELLDAAERHRR